MSYSRYVDSLASSLPNELRPKLPRVIPQTPTAASSAFLINRNIGDWGENIVYESLSKLAPDYIAVKYGRNGDLLADGAAFKKFYKSYQAELDDFGKRPDLLLFHKDDFHGDISDLSETDNEEISDLVQKAIAGIEVRSSLFLAKKFKRGTSSKFDELSYTVKVEDIAVVRKWIESTNVPHFYVQVPFDEVNAIGFHSALEIMCDGKKGRDYVVEKPAKSQNKTTVKIPFSVGRKIGDIEDELYYKATRIICENGRVILGVKVKGGNLVVSGDAWNDLIGEAKRMKSAPPAPRVTTRKTGVVSSLPV